MPTRRRTRPAVAPTRTIETLADIAEGVAALKSTCGHMRRAHALAGDPPLRRHAGGFAGLARIVVGQQVSIASANAIWSRLEAGVRPLTAAGIASCTEADLRRFGLSGPKIRTLTRLTQGPAADESWLEDLATMPEEEARSRLIALHGIGPWTADIYLMFCLGRCDGFAPGDLALQVAARDLMRLTERPSPMELTAIAERWRPWRGVAARLLWAYYAALRRKDTAVPV